MFSPYGLLAIMTISQVMMYFDRGLIAGCVPLIQRSLSTHPTTSLVHDAPDLNDAEAGVLGSGFIFGYMLACPFFAYFSRRYSPYKLMSIGLFLWINAVLLCGLTNNYITLLGGRILTGIGEASFAGLAPSVIDDVAPTKHRTFWLSIFFGGMPIGGALGYIFAGTLSEETALSWHLGFIVEAILMIPITIIVYLWPMEMNLQLSPEPNLSPPSPATLRALSAVHISSTSKANQSKSHNNLTTLFDNEEDLSGGKSAAADIDPDNRIQPVSLNELNIVPSPPIVETPVNNINFSQSHSSNIQIVYPDLENPPESLSETQPLLANQPRNSSETSAKSANSIASSKSYPNLTAAENARTVSASASKALSAEKYNPSQSNGNNLNVNGTRMHHAQSISEKRFARSALINAANSNKRASLGHLPSGSRRSSTFNSRLSSSNNLQSYSINPSQGEGDFLADMRIVMCDSVFLLVVFGYSAIAFVSGALSFWAPADFSKTLHLTLQESTEAIGLITFLCGLLGTGFGGWMLDIRCANKGKGLSAVQAAMELSVLFTSISIVFASISVWFTDAYLSLSCLALGEFFMFCVGAPVNAALLSCAPKSLRSLAMAMSILIMHMLGDLPSPFLMGYVTDNIDDVRFALVSLVAWLSFAILFWGIAAYLAKQRVLSLKIRVLAEHADLLLPVPSYQSLHDKLEGIDYGTFQSLQNRTIPNQTNENKKNKLKTRSTATSDDEETFNQRNNNQSVVIL